MARYILLLLISLLTTQAFAGNLNGIIKDASNNTPLTGVIVTVKNTDKGAATDIDGKYVINNIVDGKYEIIFSFIGYKKQVQMVTIKGNVVLDVHLNADGSALKEVNVRTNRVTHTETAVTMEMRKSNTIVSAIGSAQIAKTMDRNAADVVKRIPGVTIQDDRFITIRGLADRYNTVWLNDAGAPSSEVDKKSFSFDLIPSGLIDRIMVYKTPAPDLPGDFAGGMVKIYTTSMPEKNQLTVGFQTSSRPGSTGKDFNYNAPSSTDWLGYDNGQRSMPASTPAYISKTDASNNDLSKAFGNDWIVKNKPTPMDVRFNLSSTAVFNLKKVMIGNTLGVTYSNTNTSYNISRQDWQDTALQYSFNDHVSENKVNVGIMDNIAAVFGNSKIEFKNLYNQSGKSSVTERTSVRDSLLPFISDERSYAMAYESRATYCTELSGTHKTSNDRTKYNWTLGYSDLFRNQPDLRRIRYNKNQSDDDSMYKAQVANIVDPVYGGGRFYSRLSDHSYSFNHQLSHRFNIGGEKDLEVSVGNYIEFKDRNYSARVLGYTIRPGVDAYTLTRLPVNEIFADENVGVDGKFKIDETTSKSDRYDAKNKLYAGFVSAKLPIGNKFNVLGGVRYEYNDQSILGYVNLDSINPRVVTKYFLPSVNASYNFTPKSLARVAYGKTLNRPEFREWAPVSFYDFDLRALTYGSLFPHTFAEKGDTLKVCEVQNLDARWEWYPSAGEMVHVGVFYKSFKNPIQQVIVPGTEGSYTFANADKAYTYGLEIDFRKNLTFLADRFNADVLKYFTFVGNFAFTKSQMTLDSTRITDIIPKTTLQGQSPYVINTGLYFQHDKTGVQGSLLYNVFGPRMIALGTTFDPSRGELPFHSLDLAVSKTMLKRYTINFGVQNLLDQKIRIVDDVNRDNKFDATNDRNFKSFKPGRYISLGVKVKI